MNRSSSTAQVVSQSLVTEDQFDWLGDYDNTLAVDRQRTHSPCSYFSPIHYERGYAYPLIVWLHGPSSNEQELRQVMPLLSVQNHVAVAPRGTCVDDSTHGAYGWGQSAEEGDVVEAAQRVSDCVEGAHERFNINPRRIFLAGFAEGGTMALRIGMQHPEWFAGAISLGGAVPRGGRPLHRINDARELPLLLSVSPDENGYPLDAVMQDMRLLHFAGFSLSLRLYPEGDELTTVMLSDVDRWIMERVCSTTAQAPTS